MKVWIEKPVTELPEKDGWYIVIEKLAHSHEACYLFYDTVSQKWWHDSGTYDQAIITVDYATYLVPIEVAHVLTDKELEKVARDAWRACYNYMCDEDTYPDKEEYLKSISVNNKQQ